MKWRDSIGHEEADRISQKSAKRGTKFHTVVEHYLKNEELPKMDFLEINHFNNSRNIILDRIDNIYLQETPLYSDTLQLAGTVDCLAEFDGELSIIDFKTSRKRKEFADISSYFIQATCYSVMVEELFGLKAKTLQILFQTDEGESYSLSSKRSEWYDILIRMRKQYKEHNGC